MKGQIELTAVKPVKGMSIFTHWSKELIGAFVCTAQLMVFRCVFNISVSCMHISDIPHQTYFVKIAHKFFHILFLVTWFHRPMFPII